MDLVDEVYRLVERFPDKERFILSSQIARAVVSIPSNIAEGSAKDSEKEFSWFLSIALGSSFELETQLYIALKRDYLQEKDLPLEKIHSLQRRIQGFRNHLK